MQDALVGVSLPMPPTVLPHTASMIHNGFHGGEVTPRLATILLGVSTTLLVPGVEWSQR